MNLISVTSGATILFGPSTVTLQMAPESSAIVSRMFSQSSKNAPNASELQRDIRRRLLDGDDADKFADVTLISSDGVHIPACRNLLAIRSPFFEKLFYSNFAESIQKEVFVGIAGDLLIAVREFAYTGDCVALQSVREISETSDRKFDASVIRNVKKTISDIIDLSAAADFCQLLALMRYADETLERLILCFPEIACSVLRAVDHPTMSCDFQYARDAAIKSLRRNPRLFLVPAYDDRKSDPSSEENINAVPLFRHELGILELPPHVLKPILKKKFDPSQQEYLYQVLFYWATFGKTVFEVFHHPDTYDGRLLWVVRSSYHDQERFESAKEIMRFLDLHAMTFEFLHKFVEKSGLVSTERIMDAYRTCAMAVTRRKQKERLLSV